MDGAGSSCPAGGAADAQGSALEQAVQRIAPAARLFEVEAKRTLDEVAAKIATAKKPLVHLENRDR